MDRRKTVIVINGKGGVGKDTLIDSLIKNRSYSFVNYSSIDCIKEIARGSGYWDDDKTDAGRAFLHDLKMAYTKYCNLPHIRSLMAVSQLINREDTDLMFVHIREPEEIDKFVKAVRCKFPDVYITTLLVVRSDYTPGWENDADNDTILDYKYDHVFDNSSSNVLNLIDVEQAFANFIDQVLDDADKKQPE